MAISTTAATLLPEAVDGAVDFKGHPVLRSNSGGWRSAFFIIGVEVAERFAYYGISCNLITYLTGPLGKSTASAAASVNAWSGTASLLPLLGAFLADSFLGRYRTIIVASLLYILALSLLTLSAMLPTLGITSGATDTKVTSGSSNQLQKILFFVSLYLVAVAQGGHKPCVQAFGADQFDGRDPDECKAKSSFFNWWYLGVSLGSTVTVFVLSYVQDELSWGLGFGIPCMLMVAALGVFLLGTWTYRFSTKENEKDPLLRIGRVFVNAVRNCRATHSAISMEEAHGILPHHGFQQFKFLNKALLFPHDSREEGNVCTLNEVEEAKKVLRLVPILITCLGYAVAFAQMSTFFTKQGATMDRTLFPGFKIPAASLQCFVGISIMLFIPLYDSMFVPIARAVTNRPSGITLLQRIGIGMIISVFIMVVAALVEMKRLETAQEHGLIDRPDVTIPMSIWWLVPQYVLTGIADVFTVVGLQEFFYDQVPPDLRSVGLALYLSIFGFGNFLSGFLVSVIEEATGGNGRDSWFTDNLNKAHLDYFYWVLAGISAIALAAFLFCAKYYIYNRWSTA